MEICLKANACARRKNPISTICDRLICLARHLKARLFAASDDFIAIKSKEDESNALAVRLIDTYGNSILRMAYAYLHNLSDAEEILQDTLLSFVQNRPDVQTAEQEKAWLLRVAANKSKNRIKYNRVRETDELEETLAAEQREDLSFVWDAVKQLSPPQAQAVHLFYYERYTTAQIAVLLKKNESSIRSDLRRARMRLKEILKEEYDFE